MYRYAYLLVMSWGLISAVGCGDPVDAAREVALSCGTRECPIGTLFRETRQVEGGYDISAGFDPTTYKADGAFKRFGEGSCEYACEVMQPCGEGLFPVITASCFTCGALNSEEEVVQGACD